MTLAQLPRGTHSFSELRSKNDIYVDKTEQICTLATQAGKFFISRPRGFGKSLLISTLASLFSQGLNDFQGRAIELLWQDTTY